MSSPFRRPEVCSQAAGRTAPPSARRLAGSLSGPCHVDVSLRHPVLCTRCRAHRSPAREATLCDRHTHGSGRRVASGLPGEGACPKARGTGQLCTSRFALGGERAGRLLEVTRCLDRPLGVLLGSIWCLQVWCVCGVSPHGSPHTGRADLLSSSGWGLLDPEPPLGCTVGRGSSVLNPDGALQAGEATIGARGTAAPALRPGHHARPPPSFYTGSDPPAAACLPSVTLRLIMFLLLSFHCCFILRERKQAH